MAVKYKCVYVCVDVYDDVALVFLPCVCVLADLRELCRVNTQVSY